jgi:hypothetical protein
VYLCCLESIQNAAKHAGRGASLAVRLRRDGNELAFSVHDTGRGFDPRATARGAGLTGLKDRIGALGSSGRGPPCSSLERSTSAGRPRFPALHVSGSNVTLLPRFRFRDRSTLGASARKVDSSVCR